VRLSVATWIFGGLEINVQTPGQGAAKWQGNPTKGKTLTSHLGDCQRMRIGGGLVEWVNLYANYLSSSDKTRHEVKWTDQTHPKDPTPAVLFGGPLYPPSLCCPKGSESLTCCCRLAAFRATSAPFSVTSCSRTPPPWGYLCGTVDTGGRQLLTLKSQPHKDTPTIRTSTTGRVCVQGAHLTTSSHTHWEMYVRAKGWHGAQILIRQKYFPKIVCLLMEISFAQWLTLFLFLSLYLSVCESFSRNFSFCGLQARPHWPITS